MDRYPCAIPLSRSRTCGPSSDGAGEVGLRRDLLLEEDEALSSGGAPEEPDPETSALRSPLQVLGRLERRVLRPPLAGRTVFGLLTLEAPEAEAKAEAEAELPMDVVCVVDVSGSMAGAKMDELKAAVTFLAETLQAKDRLALVVFNSSAECALPLRRMTAEGREAALAAVARKCRADGGTSIVAGLAVGLTVLERRRHRNAVAGLVLLTDGIDGDAAAGAELQKMARRASAAGASIYCLGFGLDHDAALLRGCAEASRTPFAYVSKPEDLAPAFASVVGGLAGVAAQRVKLRLRPCAAAPRPQVTTTFEVAATEAYVEVRIPDLCFGERRDVPVEWAISEELLGEVPLLVASAEFHDPRSRALVTVEEACVIVATVEVAASAGEPEEEPDLEVAVQRARCETARALEKAAALGRAGDAEAARGLVEAHRSRAAQLLTRGRTAPCESLLADLERAGRELASGNRWSTAAEATLQAAAHGQALQRHVTTDPHDRDCTASQRRWLGMAATSA